MEPNQLRRYHTLDPIQNLMIKVTLTKASYHFSPLSVRGFTTHLLVAFPCSTLRPSRLLTSRDPTASCTGSRGGSSRTGSLGEW